MECKEGGKEGEDKRRRGKFKGDPDRCRRKKKGVGLENRSVKNIFIEYTSIFQQYIFVLIAVSS